MDGGQFRVPQRTSRGTVSRPEPARRPIEKPQSPVEEPPREPAARPVPSSRSQKNDQKPTSTPPKKNRRLWLTGVGIGAVLLVVAGYFAWSNVYSAAAPGIDSGKYQAVFLVNGDIYFGKLEPASRDHMKLTNIYYIQSQANSSTENTQQTEKDKNNVQLIKLGEEIYGPEDMMIISRDQIMLYENLKPDSKVAKAIESYTKK